MSSSVGKVTVGTGPCVFVNEFQKARLWLQYNRLLGSHPDLKPSSGVTSISSLFSGFLSGFFSPPLLLTEGVCHVVPWKELSSGGGRGCGVTRRFPRSLALPPQLLLAHRSGQEDGATRPLGVRANLGRLCWVSVVFNGIYDKFACVSSEAHHRKSKRVMCVCMLKTSET